MEQQQRYDNLKMGERGAIVSIVAYICLSVRWLDIRFSEYHSVFKDWTCKRSLATLKTIPCTQDLENYRVPDVIDAWRVHMQRAGGLTGLEKAAQLIAQAKCSVGEQAAKKQKQI
ncbi:hypothetical protein PALU110988_29165 [Paenibacillus lupini]|uniref:hypothetical protein n=1 Tax=Paenibacillus lupini TaxID=1450204 RepID=UPI00142225AE|nr:hypothetical protein [Paenibacillus lupini]NIK22018.1 hypothetical protein [Paenibacillus lupini]